MKISSTRPSFVDAYCSRTPGTYSISRRRTRPPNATLSEIQNWLESTFDRSDTVDISGTDESFSLYANQQLKKGETFLSVKEEKWISLDTVSKSRIGKGVQNLEPWLQLALYLISEESRSNATAEYYLSRPLNSPAFCSEEELRSIAGTQLYESAVNYKSASISFGVG